MEMWAQITAAPCPPTKKNPEQRQQQQGNQNQMGEGLVEVKRQQKKEEMKPDFPGQKSMQKS